MAQKADLSSFGLKEVGPGTDVESYANTRRFRTHADQKLKTHLEGLLKEGIKTDSQEDAIDGLTYGHAILAAVVYERYDMAVEELETILGIKADYPDFGDKAGRFVQHAKSIVRAIKAKRAVGKLPHVSKTKQKELTVALGQHFKELRACIGNIEKVERFVRKEDLSSTRWVVLSIYWWGFAIFLVAMLLATFPDVFIAFHSFLTHYLHVFFSWAAQVVWPI